MNGPNDSKTYPLTSTFGPHRCAIMSGSGAAETARTLARTCVGGPNVANDTRGALSKQHPTTFGQAS